MPSSRKGKENKEKARTTWKSKQEYKIIRENKRKKKKENLKSRRKRKNI